MSSVVSSVTFKELSQLCEILISSDIRDKKVDKLKKFVVSFQEYAAKQKLVDPTIETSFYPILRLLLPQLDRERGPYGFKEHALAKTLIRELKLPNECPDALKLMNYKMPSRAGTQAGDFAEVAYWVLRSRFTQAGQLNVEQVNVHLDAIADKHAAHEPRGVDDELHLLLMAMSAEEQKWLIRMILKDMKLGLGHTKILTLFHPDAQELFDVCNSLERVCRELGDPTLRLNEIEVSLFSPFRAMLSERCDVSTVEKVLRKAPFYCYVETKHDGERFQLHLNNGEFKYFSKNGYEYTDTFGGSQLVGLLTPHIARLLRPDIHSCILDGEMMAWDKEKQCFKAKGLNFDVKSLRPGDKRQPCFCVFDILLLNDQILTNKPLEERYKFLDGVFQQERGVLALTKRRKVSHKDEIIEELNYAIDHLLEGIILKNPTSVYKPNTRKGGWFKIKPEYSDGTMDHVDALIIGGYYGEGRQRGVIGHFLVGLAVPSSDGSSHPAEFHSMGRVGSGYTMTKLAELQQKLAPYWQKVKPGGSCPPRVVWTKEKPDVWIAPENSYVLEIKATEICYSVHFKTSYTLKFPRVEHIRYEKPWHDCMTTLEFERLREGASGKLSSRHVTGDSALGEPPAKKPRQVRTAPSLAAQNRGADLTALVPVSELLSGRELCVLTGTSGATKQQLETNIARNGGSVVQNVGPKTFCAIAGDDSLRVRNVVKSGQHDVVRVQWLLDLFDKEGLVRLPPYTPSDLITASPNTAKLLAEDYDQFGDSYTKPATMESLLIALDRIKVPDVAMDQGDIADLDIELFSHESPYGIFRTCVAYLDPKSKALDIVSLDFCFYGGTTCDQIQEESTHVIIHSCVPERRTEYEAVNRQRDRKLHIVTERWVEESLKRGRRLPERQFYDAL